MNLNILQAYCKKRKYGYTSAFDGRQAFEAYADASEAGEPPTIILLDLQMPVCNGIECARLIRCYEKERGLARCPIIIGMSVTSCVDLAMKKKNADAELSSDCSKRRTR